MKKGFTFISIGAIFFLIGALPLLGKTQGFLTPEEDLWLKSRNSVIVVHPEKNDPPFSYTSAGGNIQGLSIDYMELIAEKVGAKIEYLSPKSRSQIIDELKTGKGDVATGLTAMPESEVSFIFTDSYIAVPTVIVVRKDFEKRKALTLNDMNGKRVSVVSGSALEGYIRENYPRVVIEDVTDDEVSLQQVVLGEVEAAALDVASLSFYLSKQVLSSVKIVGNTGFDYKPSFALLKDKAMLQAILEKGMTQISITERTDLTDKWINVPIEEGANTSFMKSIEEAFTINGLYALIGVIMLLGFVALFHHKRGFRSNFLRKAHDINELKKEFEELEEVNELLSEELNEVKTQESKLKEKINSF
ncbi:MAG: transporter substrate-binding domain-containing protein [bacterium]|nr:transporter substrate-binding domain-containing protein [bacterium]